MGKLIDRLVIGMSMREVRKLIPYKPYMINPETVMDQQTGKTEWIYTNSKGSLKIFFKDSIYIGHEITPILDFKLTLSESELIKLAERKIPLFCNSEKRLMKIIQK